MSADAARETDKATIKQAQALLRENHADQMRTIGAIRSKDQQRRQMLYTGIGTALVVSLVWLIYPGWTASLGPQSWHWPERVAQRTMGEPSLWGAGIRLMGAGNPEGWQAIVDAAEMRQANRDAIAACEMRAAKIKKSTRCVIITFNKYIILIQISSRYCNHPIGRQNGLLAMCNNNPSYTHCRYRCIDSRFLILI